MQGKKKNEKEAQGAEQKATPYRQVTCRPLPDRVREKIRKGSLIFLSHHLSFLVIKIRTSYQYFHTTHQPSPPQ